MDFPGELDANTSTIGSISVGGTTSSAIEDPSDRDWFRIELTQGQRYQLDLSSADGSDGLSNPNLRLYQNGSVVASDDDAGPGLASRIIYTASSTGTYYLEASAPAAQTGQYVLSATDLSQSASLPSSASLLNAIDWGTGLDTNTVNVYFAENREAFGGHTSFEWTEYEIAQVQAVLAEIESVVDITFNHVQTPDDAEFRFVIQNSPFLFAGVMFPPGELNEGVGIFSRSALNTEEGRLEQGGSGFQILLHEIGHGLGLAHPHDTGGSSAILNGVDADFGDFGDYGLNQGVFTNLSYNQGYRSETGREPSRDFGVTGTLSPLDIAVLQAHYGARNNANDGATIYDLPTINAAGTFYSAIWDTSGADWLTHNGAGDATLDLRAATLEYEIGGGGYVSHVDGIFGGFTIANGVVIENARGGSGRDMINGNDSANLLIGGLGADILTGGAGNDRYFVDDAGDVVVEGVDGGTADFIYSEVSYTSVANVERLALTGTANIDATGLDAQADLLLGNSGNNRIDGKGGADYMRGFLGNDFYYVDHVGDAVDERAGEGGADYVFSTVSYTVVNDIERLYLEGAGDINGTGRGGFADILTGNSGDNRLDGKGGADLMRGGAGNDFYFVDHAGDVVDEAIGGGGIGDYIFSTASFATSTGIERLYLEGTADINATGRDGAADILVGNSGNNILDGKSGVDVMRGGLGSDTYFVDNAADVVDEGTGGGGSADSIFTTTSYQIAAGVERLFAVEGAGGAVGLTARNNQSDIIIGNSGTNVFVDQFGRDTFVGGGGADFFRFIANLDGMNNVNRINDFDAADDQFQLLQAVYSQIDVGILDASKFVLGTAASDANDRIIYDQTNGVVSYDPDGTGAAEQTEIVNVAAGTTITADDFQIF